MATLSIVNLIVSGVAGVVVIVGLITLNKGRRSRKLASEMGDTEVSRVQDVEPGPVKLEGVATPTQADGTLVGPLSGQEALATSINVKGNDRNHDWLTLHQDRQAVPFHVDDGTGVARVDPITDPLNLEGEGLTVEAGEEPPPKVHQFAERVNMDKEMREQLISDGRHEYWEALIEPGEEVFVYGEAREATNTTGDAEYVIDGELDPTSFVLSDKSGSVNVESEGTLGILLYVVGAFMFGIGGIVLLGGLTGAF